MTDKVIIYTDGACKGNPGPGGWGAFLNCKGSTKELFGGQKKTTNNRMELLATIKALSSLTRRCDVELFTDSHYVKNGITKWMDDWKKRGWKTAAKKEVKNKDLWEKLDKCVQLHNVSWRWVKGHSGDPGNEKADQLANKGVYSL